MGWRERPETAARYSRVLTAALTSARSQRPAWLRELAAAPLPTAQSQGRPTCSRQPHPRASPSFPSRAARAHLLLRLVRPRAVPALCQQLGRKRGIVQHALGVAAVGVGESKLGDGCWQRDKRLATLHMHATTGTNHCLYSNLHPVVSVCSAAPARAPHIEPDTLTRDGGTARSTARHRCAPPACARRAGTGAQIPCPARSRGCRARGPPPPHGAAACSPKRDLERRLSRPVAPATCKGSITRWGMRQSIHKHGPEEAQALQNDPGPPQQHHGLVLVH